MKYAFREFKICPQSVRSRVIALQVVFGFRVISLIGHLSSLGLVRLVGNRQKTILSDLFQRYEIDFEALNNRNQQKRLKIQTK